MRSAKYLLTRPTPQMEHLIRSQGREGREPTCKLFENTGSLLIVFFVQNSICFVVESLVKSSEVEVVV